VACSATVTCTTKRLFVFIQNDLVEFYDSEESLTVRGISSPADEAPENLDLDRSWSSIASYKVLAIENSICTVHTASS
jgi:hypothetical protein